MPTKRITLEANNIDGTAQQIIHLLEDTDKGGDIIYFHGWAGWGASVVLKEVVKRLRSSLGSANTGTAWSLENMIIHVDSSRWQSKRVLQKEIAKELELPQQVMALFDQCDEEDDFDGVEQSARGVIPHVKVAIMNKLNARRFLVVWHNWSGGYIELREFGVPLIAELSKRVLWTCQGRFWPHVTARHGKEDVEELAGLSDVAICVDPSSPGDDEDGRNILYAEIEEIAKYTSVLEPDMSREIVTECILYRAARGNDQDISWESHASNYWVCDGIIQDATDGSRSAWEISEALQRNINLDLCNECAEEICQLLSGDQWRHIDRWVSATSQNSKEVKVPSLPTSFFCTRVGSSSVDHDDGTTILEAGLFEHTVWSNLRVMHLSYSKFSFSSPPFWSCKNLRFLILDHCKDQDAQDPGEEKEYKGNGACFRKLCVLELSYTDWYWLLSKDMLDLMVDLRELNVKGVGNWSMMDLHPCSGGNSKRKLIKLRVVADDSNKALDNDDVEDDGTGDKRNQQVSPPVVASSFFPDLSSWHILKTVILDGCSDLELIDCNALPLSLESFTLISSVTASKIKRISFKGRTKLKNLLLRGLFDSLEELDMSGTTIRTLDLSATQATSIKRLLLLGCKKLCAILWPQEKNKKIWLEILRIDTTTTTYTVLDRKEGKSNEQEATASDSASISIGSSSSAMVCGKDQTIIDSDSYISVRDPRLFRSLVSLRHGKWLHVEISSIDGHKGTSQGGGADGAVVNVHKRGGSLYAGEIIISTSNGSNLKADDDANRDFFMALVMRSKWLWGCPPIPQDSDWTHCYINIQDETQIELLQDGTATTTRQLITRATTLPALVNDDAKTLHLHDSLFITCLPGPTPAAEAKLDWNILKWCRLERCTNLEGVVFNAPRQDVRIIFYNLETFWASQLPKACSIWDWSTSGFLPGESSFRYLVFLHLDYCPRLVHVLPLYTSNVYGCHSLETLEIVCCGDLREVFPLDLESQQEEQPREFPRLKRIHLYELPKLQRIGGRRMLAPNLMTVKVRGCWSLKRLPAIRAEAKSSNKAITPVDLDCEKEWWDNLEWDGKKAGHCTSHYKPTCSEYYKKQQLRASVLR